MKTKILKALQNSNPNGFTTPLTGTLARYVVAYTHNEPDISVEELTQQATTWNVLNFENINIWGWQDTETWKRYIDISTSFDNLEQAKYFAGVWSQIAIWDNVEQKEIRI